VTQRERARLLALADAHDRLWDKSRLSRVGKGPDGSRECRDEELFRAEQARIAAMLREIASWP
jgi:hypothetical protein